jgi:hypothetical protein
MVIRWRRQKPARQVAASQSRESIGRRLGGDGDRKDGSWPKSLRGKRAAIHALRASAIGDAPIRDRIIKTVNRLPHRPRIAARTDESTGGDCVAAG